MAKVLVTGAAGQVGSRLVRQLLEKNYEVRGLILPEDPNRKRIDGLGIEVVEGNLMDVDTAIKVAEGVDAIIHTANLVGPLPGMSQSEFFANNVQATYNIAYAASRHADKLQRFVYTSSSSVYPNDSQILATAYNPVDELHPTRPIGTYAASKLAGEAVVQALSRETGMRVSMIRPSGIVSGTAVLSRWTVGFVSIILKIGQQHPKSALYMPDGTELWHELERAASSPQQPCAITDMEGRPWIYQLIHASDAAHGLICALESPAAVGEAFNAAAPRPITYPEAAEILARIKGQEVLQWRVPVRWVFDLDISKAKSWIGYQPKWDIARMIQTAADIEEGRADAAVVDL